MTRALLLALALAAAGCQANCECNGAGGVIAYEGPTRNVSDCIAICAATRPAPEPAR